MIKKWFSFTLTCLLLVTTNFSLISAQTQDEKTASSIAKVKSSVLKRQTKDKKRVKVIMLNGSELKGYISQAGEDSFELTDSKTKQSNSIFYKDVAKVRGNGLSKTAIISLAAVGAAAAVVLIVVLAPICNEGGC
jgi:sRNA-binding regulator protein Hfq